MSDEKYDENEVTLNVLNLMLNNDWEEGDKILLKYKDHSPQLSYCHALFKFTKAILIFEENELDKSLKDLEKTQKLCKEFIKIHGLAKKNQKTSTQIQTDSTKPKLNLIAEKISKDIIIADCKLYIALLTILKQDIAGIITNGVFELRRAWKIYSTIQKKLFNLFKELEPNAEQIYGTDPNKLPDITVDDASDTASNNPDDNIIHEIAIDTNNASLNDDGLNLETVRQLLASVSFGFGVVQLCFSFLPPSVLKLMKFIGFEGDRSAALKALYFTSHSNDMRSSFADLMLVFYSTTGRQMFGESEVEMYLNDKEVFQIVEKNLANSPKSCLYLMQKSKYYQVLARDLAKSLEFALAAQENAAKLPEIKCITWYEIGISNLLNLDYQSAMQSFSEFAKSSKWSLSFNALLAALLSGCLGNIDQANQQIKLAGKISQKNKNPIELCALRRIEFLKKYTIKNAATCQFFLLESLYLFAFIQFADEAHLNKMLEILDQQNEKNLYAIKSLIEGSIQLSLKNADFAEQLFKESIARDEKSAISKYVQPYANIQLCYLSLDKDDLASAVAYLNKAKTFKDYELEDRIQIQMRCIQRRIDYKKSLKK